jgi:hypothetical protein
MRQRSGKNESCLPIGLLALIIGLAWAPGRAQATCASPRFSSPPAVTVPVGALPFAIGAGLLNQDGHVDLAVTNVDGNNVSVLLGSGTGAFNQVSSFSNAAGGGVSALAVGDLDGDGKQDLVVSNGANDGLTTFLGAGDGSFGSGIVSPPGGFGTAMALGDINGDSRPDLAVASFFGGGYLEILLGTGMGDFTSAGVVHVGLEVLGLALGDFNDDNHLDLVASDGSEHVVVFLGAGDGTFSDPISFPTGHGPRAIALGDLNGDGGADLAVVNSASNSVSILLTSAGTFVPGNTYAVGADPFSIAEADFNGDGARDLAVANLDDNTVSVLLGDGHGAFGAATTFTVGSGPRALLSEDFNGDGAPDLAVANGNDNSVSILLNTCTPLAQGELCGGGADCASGFCSDGVCCNSACGGSDANDCQACSVAAGAAVDGTCALLSGACDDGSVCTQGDQCQAGVCVGTAIDCHDADPCTQDSCDAIAGCQSAHAPAPTCHAADGATLSLKHNADATKDRLIWKWKGTGLTPPDFGDPTFTTGYTLCLYAGTASAPVAAAGLPAGAGWSAAGSTGFKFKGASPDGLTNAHLSASRSGKSHALIKGKGAALPAVPLPSDLPLIVQLVDDSGSLCLGSEFSSVKKNDAARFSAAVR